MNDKTRTDRPSETADLAAVKRAADRGRDPWGLVGEFVAGFCAGASHLLAPGEHRNAEVLCFKGGKSLAAHFGKLLEMLSSFAPMIYTGILRELSKSGGSGQTPSVVPMGGARRSHGDEPVNCQECGGLFMPSELYDGVCGNCEG